MPNIWTSSTKPLYVKRINKDGLPYTLLSHEEFELIRSARKTKSSLDVVGDSKKILNRDKTSKMLSGGKDILKLTKFSRVDLVKAGEDIKKNHSNTSVRKVKIDTEVFAVSVKQEELHDPRNLVPPPALNSISSARVKVEDSELSQRVMQWLDLAGNQDLITQCTEEMHIDKHRKSYPTIQTRFYERSCDLKDIDAPKIDNEDSRLYDVITRDEIDFGDRVSVNKGISVAERGEDVNMDSVVQSRKKTKPYGADASKRQLHIFIPALAKKHNKNGGKVGSVLSTSSITSKISNDGL